MREFTDVIRSLNKGKLADELTETLTELIASCQATGKKGELVLKIKMKPGKSASPMMTIDHEIKAKIPEFERPTEFLFVTQSNALVMQNPDQGKLGLEVVQQNRGEPIIDTETGEIIGYKAVPPAAAPVAEKREAAANA